MNEKAIEAAAFKRDCDVLRYRLDSGRYNRVAEDDLIQPSDLRKLLNEIERLSALPPLRAREEIAAIKNKLIKPIFGEPGLEGYNQKARAHNNALNAFANAILSSIAGQEWREPKWQHVKRGSIVTEIARGFAQVAHHPIEEMTAVVIYRHDDDGHWWVRNAVEFDDGRFVPIPPSSSEACR